jgi:hypothetical protein
MSAIPVQPHGTWCWLHDCLHCQLLLLFHKHLQRHDVCCAAVRHASGATLHLRDPEKNTVPLECMPHTVQHCLCTQLALHPRLPPVQPCPHAQPAGCRHTQRRLLEHIPLHSSASAASSLHPHPKSSAPLPTRLPAFPTYTDLCTESLPLRTTSYSP